MSWKETNPMCERSAFIRALKTGKVPMAALCREFGISRKTGYKLLGRFEAEGEEGLLERSRASRHHPNQVPRAMEDAIIALRAKRCWGPKKLAILLARDWPLEQIPAISTIGDILKRNGLVVPRKLRRHCSPSTEPLAHAVACNLVWCADFKGWFFTGDGARVDPLTVTDAYSRYLLGCQVLSGKTDTIHAMAVFETLFRIYGLPARIRTDNGTPFASTGLYGLSRLAVWFMRLGIIPERIKPATPSENGRHERFHLTLKQEAATPPASTPKKQQEVFDRFRVVYNEERPHEALGQVPPATLYAPSPRPYPEKQPCIEYDDDLIVRRARGTGNIKWRGQDVAISAALQNQPIGLKPCGDGLYEIYFCKTCIGLFNERTMKVKALPPNGQQAK